MCGPTDKTNTGQTKIYSQVMNKFSFSMIMIITESLSQLIIQNKFILLESSPMYSP